MNCLRGIVFVLLIITAQADAAELVVLSSVGGKAAMDQIAREFERDGHRVTLRYDTSAALKRDIQNGAAFDLALLTPQVAAALESEQRLNSERWPFAYARIGLAGRRGAPKPDISTTESFARALLGAENISLAQEGASGQHFRKVLNELGMADKLKDKLLPMTGSKEIEAVAEGRATYGVQLISEILAVHGAELIGAFPKELQSVTELDLVMSSQTKLRDEASKFIAFARSEGARKLVAQSGLEPPQHD